jgi:hypothetical protein
VRQLREQLYPPLAGIANAWAVMLGERRFPATHRELAEKCVAEGQRKPTPLILHYSPGDHANLHQDLYGGIVFPLQIAIILSRPGEEFEGGESVFVEQRPRSQSRAIVVRPTQGQGIVFRGGTGPYPAAADTEGTRCATGPARPHGDTGPYSGSSSAMPADLSPPKHPRSAARHRAYPSDQSPSPKARGDGPVWPFPMDSCGISRVVG